MVLCQRDYGSAIMSSPVDVIVVGAGNRGENYSNYAVIFPERMRVVGIADPRDFARKKLQARHKVADENTFNDWHCIVEKEKFADAVLICSPDRLHKDPAVALAKKGYHVLLEKPMAVTEEDCTEIVEACIQSGVMLTVCHVLRYDPVIHRIKGLIDSGVIGDVIHIQHLEPVGFYHFAHSFVRGNWRNEAESSFALLAKSCHDLDLIHHWAGGRRCIKVSSFGSLSHFTKENKGGVGWPVSVICSNSVPDIESVTEALRTGPYGRCVYECDNDVCSNQVVNMEFEGGLTAAFTMVAFTEEICLRKTSIHGSKGELSYNGYEIKVFDFLTRKTTKYTADMKVPGNFGTGGHGAADYHLIDSFIAAVKHKDPSRIRSGPKETLASHKLVFAAERARMESRVVFCDYPCEGESS
ncbi:4-carboxy-2-hydroxymuconate-6-semialdehyde dehydrogenase-like isoform X3 [Carassius carassius]|uniref:4-carboxy-2-hydroxymuconate-6-semialdehyde dehydrogenase-like isoform X3 n=1 Tax=Carassius carassius TaxID=217509 RepID=UPI0028684A72|nr:4-carboxy-2-hydroxymuconate-6-semialdehyde dehydrogenase-like isoform X3 [Carassius carassius]